MEDFLVDFTSQLEKFQKAFKPKSLTSNHLLWAEAEESRLSESLAQISKQNQLLQSQIDNLLSRPASKPKLKQSPLKSEIVSLTKSISSISQELVHVDKEIRKKDEIISTLMSKLEILNPPDLGMIGLPSEWKYLESKQIEYEIISPRFMNDSDDSVKDFNELTVFSPRNKEKRTSCKSMDVQANTHSDFEDLHKVYAPVRVEKIINRNKDVVVEEYKIGDDEELEDEKMNKEMIIEYAEEVTENNKVEDFKVDENCSKWAAEVADFELIEAFELKVKESESCVEELKSEGLKDSEQKGPADEKFEFDQNLLSHDKEIEQHELKDSAEKFELVENKEEVNAADLNKEHPDEEKKDVPEPKKVIEPPQPPAKKFFTKYQPKVIPKKLQAKKGQIDDFFNELL